MTELRYERKYLLDLLDYRQIRSELLLHPASLRTQHEDRVVRNIYFDTRELTALHTNLRGVQERSKHRLRWYGDKDLPHGRARWETKMKINMLGAKSVIDLDIPMNITISELASLVKSTVEPTSQLVPVLLNSYRRSYFITADGKFRFTIDRDLEYTPILGEKKTTEVPFQSRHTVVELKYDQQWDDEASDILRHLSIRQTKSSKYVTGLLTNM